MNESNGRNQPNDAHEHIFRCLLEMGHLDDEAQRMAARWLWVGLLCRCETPSLTRKWIAD